MSYALTGHSSWGLGFCIVSILQIVLTAALFFSLPLWKKGRRPGTAHCGYRCSRIRQNCH